MSIQTKDRVLLSKIIDEIDVITTVVAQITCDAFTIDKVSQHAVMMALLNTGELAKSLSETVVRATQEIPWKQVIGLRNIAAHGYASLEMPDIWKTITEDIPVLKRVIERLLIE